MYMVVSFSLSTIHIKTVERKRQKDFILQEFLTSDSFFKDFMNGQSESWPETGHHNFLSVVYFLVHPIEKCSQLFLL